MGNFIKTQSSFANGEIAPEFWTRDDINGLAKLENMDVLSGGGLRRRRGLVRVANLADDVRLIPFSVGGDDNYLLAMGNRHIQMFHNGIPGPDILSPWPKFDLAQLQYAQRFNSIIFVHPDYRPMVLKQIGDTFDLVPFSFARNDADMSENIPFMRFDDADGINITVSSNSAGNNFATFTTNSAFWTPENVGDRVLVMNKQWLIEQYISPTQVRALTNGTYSVPSAPISEWYEAAFGSRRGWPVSITFHQDRLVFGGSRSYPGGVWMSQVGRHNNFDVGTGLDDEAIFITLLSQQRQEICTVVSSDNLQILTTVGEWAVSNKPLTPSSVDIKQHTSVGSVSDVYLPPQKIEGATVFVSHTKKDIRELTLDALCENYNATNLCAMAQHLMNNPTAIAYNSNTRQLFVVMASGEMAVFNYDSALGISAWGTYTTRGKFCSVAVIDGDTFVVVLRNNEYFLERFADEAMQDAGQYPFQIIASGIPLRSGGHNALSVRIRRITARVLNTKSISINGVRVALPNEVYEENSDGFTGDVSRNMLGINRDVETSPWTIFGTDSLPITILSVTMYGHYLI